MLLKARKCSVLRCWPGLSHMTLCSDSVVPAGVVVGLCAVMVACLSTSVATVPLCGVPEPSF